MTDAPERKPLNERVQNRFVLTASDGRGVNFLSDGDIELVREVAVLERERDYLREKEVVWDNEARLTTEENERLRAEIREVVRRDLVCSCSDGPENSCQTCRTADRLRAALTNPA